MPAQLMPTTFQGPCQMLDTQRGQNIGKTYNIL